MLNLETKYFNEVQVDDKKFIYFEDGIPGFEERHRFTLINPSDEPDLFFLQSIEDPEVCFVMMYPALLIGDYSIEINDDIVRKLDIKVPEDIAVYTIVNMKEDLKESTANLKAPVIINFKNQRAIQGILDKTDFTTKEKVFIKN